jgi:cell cycle checkpoint control protein RAD9A
MSSVTDSILLTCFHSVAEVLSAIPRSQHHLSNWVGADDDEDDNEDEELLVQTTPHYMD